jgi:hypothetical protein
MRKKMFSIVTAFLFTLTISAQIKVLSTGEVNLGKTSAEYLKIDYTGYYGTQLAVYPSTANCVAYLGKSSNRWLFIYSHNVLQVSDSRFKENIRKFDNSLPLIKRLNVVKFDYKINSYLNDSTKVSEKVKNNLQKIRKNNVGFLAQEVMKVLPEVVFYDDSTDIYSIDYIKIIPFLVQAINEQQAQIDSLKKINVKSNNLKKSAKLIQDENSSNNSDVVTLEQNAPNPFSQTTTINYYLPETIKSASLNIYDMNGLQLKTIPLYENGKGNIIINGNEFQPGMYLYIILYDGKSTDTKRMILTQ